jgi:DNA-binding winged helix-turn-helix (wHTH) protein/tetratricopeptide (TPR) repeat protein
MGEHTPRAGQGGRWRFGVFEFDAETPELRKSGRIVALRPQPLRILGELLARPGEVVSREELKRALWGDDTFVDFDQGLNHAIRELRAALGDAAESPRFIQTLQRRGYRLIGPVEQVVAAPDALRPGAPSTNSTSGSAGVSVATITSATPIRSRIWAVTIAAAFLAAIGVVYLGLHSSEARTPARPREIVVRPFTSPADPALGAGIAHAITARLGSQQSVAVRSDASGSGAGAHALEGDLLAHGNEVTAVVRLQDAAGRAFWSDQIKVRADELFSLEDVIAERVVDALRLRLAAGEQERLRLRYTSNSVAYGEYLRGRAALVQYTRDGTLAAIAAFARALAHDPDYALARAGLAMASADMCLRFAAPEDVERWGERADAEARAALESNEDLAEAHLARAAVARKREFDWNATVSSARRALALNPNLEQARFFMAAAYYHNGFMEEARIEMEKGRALHGIDRVESLRTDALIALFSGSFAAARGRLEEVSRLTSQPIGDTYLALAEFYTGRADRARSILESLVRSESASTATRAGAALASILAAQGEPAAARAHLDRVRARGYRDHHVAYSLGAAYAQLGEFEAATRWLRTAADTGFACPPFYERDPLLEPVRRHSDFAGLSEYVRTRRDIALSGTHH